MAATKRKGSLRGVLDEIGARLGSSKRRGEVEQRLGASPDAVRARMTAELARSHEPRRAVLAEALGRLGTIEREVIQRVVLREGRDALTRLLAEMEAAKVVIDAMTVDAHLIDGWRHSVFGDAAGEMSQHRDYARTLAKFIAATREQRDALTGASEAAVGRGGDPLMPVAQRLADGGFALGEIACLLVGDQRRSTRQAVKLRLFRFRNYKTIREPASDSRPPLFTLRDALALWPTPLTPVVEAGQLVGARVRGFLDELGTRGPTVTKSDPEDS